MLTDPALALNPSSARGWYIGAILRLFERMAGLGMRLLIPGDVTGPEVDLALCKYGRASLAGDPLRGNFFSDGLINADRARFRRPFARARPPRV
jgi:hypothetical protein